MHSEKLHSNLGGMQWKHSNVSKFSSIKYLNSKKVMDILSKNFQAQYHKLRIISSEKVDEKSPQIRALS